jgi:hypothetical protein
MTDDSGDGGGGGGEAAPVKVDENTAWDPTTQSYVTRSAGATGGSASAAAAAVANKMKSTDLGAAAKAAKARAPEFTPPTLNPGESPEDYETRRKTGYDLYLKNQAKRTALGQSQ